MSDDVFDRIVFLRRPAVEAPAPQQLPPPELGFFAPPEVPAEKVQALDQLFATDGKQSAEGAGLLSAWSAGMLLNDLIQDIKAQRAEEEEEEKADPRRRPALRPE